MIIQMIIIIVTILTVIVPILIKDYDVKIVAMLLLWLPYWLMIILSLHYTIFKHVGIQGNSMMKKDSKLHSSSLGAISEVQVMETWYSRYSQHRRYYFSMKHE